MPRFHLNFYNAHGDLPDVEGANFADAGAARLAAIEGIRSVLAAEVLEGELNMIGHLDIVSNEGAIVEAIAFTDALRIVTQNSPAIDPG